MAANVFLFFLRTSHVANPPSPRHTPVKLRPTPSPLYGREVVFERPLTAYDIKGTSHDKRI
jgi:hypothetical protein